MALLGQDDELEAGTNLGMPSPEQLRLLWQNLPDDYKKQFTQAPSETVIGQRGDYTFSVPHGDPDGTPPQEASAPTQGVQLHSPNPDAPTSYGAPDTPPPPSIWETMRGMSWKDAAKIAATVGANFLPGTSTAELPEASKELGEAHRKGDLFGTITAGMKGANSILGAIPIAGGIAKAGPTIAKEVKALQRGARTAPVMPTLATPPKAPVRGNLVNEIAEMPLPPELQSGKLADELEKIRRANPDTKFLLPNELDAMARSPSMGGNFGRMLNVLPHAANMAASAKAGAVKQGWYRAGTQAIIDVFGKEDAPRFAAMLAATSPQVSVETNLINALNIWKNWKAAGRPTDPASIKMIMGQSVQGQKLDKSVLDAWLYNTQRALGPGDPRQVVLSGPKVDSFQHNLRDNVFRVTNDAWIANSGGFDQGLLRQTPTELQLARGNPGLSAMYLANNARTREAGQLIGLHPSEVQEMHWSFVKALYEMQEKTGIPARQILQRGLLKNSDIAGTPDFATLLKQGPYGRILSDAGYGNQLSALKAHQFPQATPTLSLADQNEILETARRLEQLSERRAREGRAVTVPKRVSPPSTFAYQQAEAIPGANTGIAPQLIDASPGARANFTGRVSAAQRDTQNMDIISRNLGLNTIETRTTQGVYQPKNKPMEFQPGYAIGSEVPVSYTKRGQPRLDPVDEQRLITAATMRAANTAQEAVPYNAQVVNERGRNLVVPRKDKVEPGQMQGLLGEYTSYDLGRVAPADTGAGVNVLNFGDRAFTEGEAREIAGLLGPPTAKPFFARTTGAENPNKSYVTAPWGERPSLERHGALGSRQVVEAEMKELNRLEKMAPGSIAKLDDEAFRQQARDLHKIWSAQENVPADFLNRLRIIGEGGIPALKKAMRGRKELLPAIAGLGLTPFLIDRLGDREPSAAY